MNGSPRGERDRIKQIDDPDIMDRQKDRRLLCFLLSGVLLFGVIDTYRIHGPSQRVFSGVIIIRKTLSTISIFLSVPGLRCFIDSRNNN
jgi:hypothetical protein